MFFPLVFEFLWFGCFGAGWILLFFRLFAVCSFGLQGSNKGKENTRKKQTNQGKSKEA
jgi:hypothetical protein